MITKKAYAKVNLTLDITGRRDDGYHLVRMLMQSLDIADVLTFEKLEVNSGEERIVTQMKDKRETENAGGKKASQSSKLENEDELGVLPMGPDNLIYKVAEMLLSKYVWNDHPEYGVKITLEKNIPIAAGLSAAAAAGIGAKAYMDRKKNNDFNDDEDDDFETEEWSGDDESVNVDYDDSSDTQLDNDDDYSYQAEPEEKYGARSNEELADLQ
jgi:hypothetical protein